MMHSFTSIPVSLYLNIIHLTNHFIFVITILMINIKYFTNLEVFFMNQDKMIRVANTFDTLVNVCGKIFRAVGFVCVIFMILVLIFGEACSRKAPGPWIWISSNSI